MCRYAAPRAPGFCHSGESLRIRTLAQAERDPRGLLNRQIAGRECIRVAEAKQKINVGGPRTDTVQGRKRRVCFIGAHVADGGEINISVGDRLSDFPDRLDLRSRKAKALELIGARAAHGVMVKWLEGREQACADRGGTCGRKLLPADDGAEAGKSRLAPAETKRAGLVGNRLEPGVGNNQLREPCLKVSVGVEEVSHTRPLVLCHSLPRKRDSPAHLTAFPLTRECAEK